MLSALLSINRRCQEIFHFRWYSNPAIPTTSIPGVHEQFEDIKLILDDDIRVEHLTCNHSRAITTATTLQQEI